jgi:hypothetical protein
VVARHLEPLSCGDWTTGAGARLAILKVAAITLHRGLYTANPLVENTSWLAWQGLVAHGWRPVVTDAAVTTFVRGRSSAAAPFPEPPAGDAIFCQGWFPPDQLGRQMSSSHAALWVRGPGIARFFVQAPEPIAIRVSRDGRPHSRLVVRRLQEVRVGLEGERWHLIALDAGALPEIRGKPRGARIVAYAVP